MPIEALRRKVAVDEGRVPLKRAAVSIGLTPNGLLAILRRTGTAVRDDGRWYVLPADLARIEQARRDLGLEPYVTYARDARAEKKEAAK